MASTYLQRSVSTTGNRKKWTWSGWIKRSKLGANQYILSTIETSTTYTHIFFDSNDDLVYENYYGSGYAGRKITDMKFRDTNGWYHIVVNSDIDNSTADNRLKIYVNGEQITSFSTDSNPNTGTSTVYNLSAQRMRIGAKDTSTPADYFDGLMSHVHFVDGSQLDADTFGSTDSTTGQWKINVNPSVTYGTNGFFLFKDDASADDDSGNNNDFTASGNLDPTEDNPSNVFATANPLATNYASGLAKGNNEWTSNESGRGICQATLGMSKGKYYWEVKTVSTHGTNSSDQWNYIGIANGYAIDGDNILGNSGTNSNKLYEYALYAPDGGVYNNGSKTSYGASFTEGDILSFALDLDNNRCYAAKNGQWCNSGAWSASSPTTYFSVTDPDSTKGGFYFPAVSDGGSNVYKVWQFNFGNGYFGTTAITSEGTNASGIGKFEYDVPTGYTALCTKGLNE